MLQPTASGLFISSRALSQVWVARWVTTGPAALIPRWAVANAQICQGFPTASGAYLAVK